MAGQDHLMPDRAARAGESAPPTQRPDRPAQLPDSGARAAVQAGALADLPAHGLLRVGAGQILALQRATGNRTVTRLLGSRKQTTPARLQRRFLVRKTDFDPKASEYRHGYINFEFFTQLKSVIPTDETYKPLKNQFDNVIAPLREKARSESEKEDPDKDGSDFSNSLIAPDIPKLAELIVGQMATGYGTKGITSLTRPNVKTQFTQWVEAALVANIRPDYTVAMDEGEEKGFDQLKAIAGDAMSRVKGTASAIPYVRVPTAISDGITAIFADINGEKDRWHAAALANADMRSFTLPALLGAKVGERQVPKHYQGNHANLAGWLPPRAAPVSPLAAMLGRIKAAATPGLRATLSLEPKTAVKILKLDQDVPAGLPYHTEYRNLLAAELAAFTDGDLRLSAWQELAYGVSGYIEFSMHGSISRLVYDVATSRLYVSAHYKWREGYNPWFEVTGVPNRPI